MSRDLAPSMPVGMWDYIMRTAGRIPRHCRKCGKRFYAKLEAVRQDLALREQDEKARSGVFTDTGF
jgi:hypothetical protein